LQEGFVGAIGHPRRQRKASTGVVQRSTSFWAQCGKGRSQL
jgi:hypothetical protein